MTLCGSPPIGNAPRDRSWKQSWPCLKQPFDSSLCRDMFLNNGYDVVG